MRHINVESVRPGLRLVERDLGDFRVRGAVVTHGARALVFDTLAHPRDMRDVAEWVRGRVVEVAYSHADWDHCWGTAGLPGVAAVIAQYNAAFRFRDDVPRELEERRRTDPDYDDVDLVPPVVTFHHAMDLALDGLRVELRALPGHTSDSAVAFIPAWGILLAGDAVETPLPVVNDPGALPGWIEELERWRADPRVVQVVPSHGRVGGRELLGDTASYLRGLISGKGRTDDAHRRLEPFYRDTHARNLALIAPD